MAKIHTLTYNGTKSSDLGVFVTGSGSFDAAEFDVDKYEIPGRNGDLILSNNRYKNIEITYPAFIPKAFMDKVQNVRNWLRSSKTYARLEDTYDMDHYRLGIPTGVQSFSPENRNDGANFEMTFDCKPQRFLKVGETPETVEADVQTETGEIVTFETVAESPITSASVSLSPIQSLNGYDSPWPAGGGKNKLNVTASTQTINGVTFTVNADGSINVNGTATGDAVLVLNSFTFDGTSVVLNGCPSGGSASTYKLDAFGSSGLSEDIGNGVTINVSGARNIRIVVFSGTSISNKLFKPMIRLASESDAIFAPYSNICPISGHTGAELNRTGINVWDEQWELGTYNTNNGEKYASSAHIRCKNPVSVTPNTSYYFNTNGYNINVCFMDANMAFIDNFNSVHDVVRTTPPNCHYIVFNMAMAYGTTYNNDISINYPATDTEYHAYEGDTYSVTFSDQGTVYGGTYDFVSGKLTVTWISLTMTGNEASVQQTGRVAVKACTGALAKSSGTGQAYCSSFEALASGEWAYIYTSMAVADLMQYLRDNPTQLVYKLATPLEYTLSPQQLTTLQGQNVVWGSGPITLTYAEPYNVDNPTLFDARPLFKVTNPAEGDVIMVNGQAISFVDGYTGTVYIDCETMNAFSGAANLNSIIQATDFPVLVPGTNIVTWTGAGGCTMTPRWWEL